MVDKKILTVGLLIVTLLVSVIYVQMNAVKIRVDVDKSTFYTQELNVFGEPFGAWLVSGREYSSIFDGASKMNRRTSGIVVDSVIDEVAKTVLISRTTPYIRGPVIKESWFFDGNIDDVELFPIYHKVEVFNASGFFYRYEVRDLKYDGPTIKLVDNNMSFGLRMKVEWQDGFRWAWVYKTGILKVQYNILSDYEVYEVRLFDPVLLDDKDIVDISDKTKIVNECTTKQIPYNVTVDTYVNITCCEFLVETPLNLTNTSHIYNNCSSKEKGGEELKCSVITKKNGTKIVTKYENVTTCYEVAEVNGKLLNYTPQNFNCSNSTKETDTIICDSCWDGNCDGVCNPNGGETCAYFTDTVVKYKNSVVSWDDESGRVDIPKMIISDKTIEAVQI